MFTEAITPRQASFNEADVKDKPEYIRTLPLLNFSQQQKIDRLYQKRLRSLQALDEGLATLIATLQANHQLDNTYIIFSSDNGFHLGQHRLPPAKETAYEEDIHLPLYIRGPNVPPGKIIDEIVGNIDLAPTLAELAQAKIPRFVDGLSLVTLWRSNLLLPAWRKVFLLEHRQDNPTALIPDYLGLRTANCTYVKYANQEQELYNLSQDPYQLNNLAQIIQPKIIKQYARRLVRLSNCQEQTCRQVELKPLPNCTIDLPRKNGVGD